MNILIFGGTGFIGKALVNKLCIPENTITLVSRNPERHSLLFDKNVIIIPFPENLKEEIEKNDAIINLAGEPISAKRWTKAQKEKIIKSRINFTKSIVNNIGEAYKRPEVLINVSAVGYYGNTKEEDINESAAKGKGFLADVCEKWEYEAINAEKYGVRVVIPRLGIILEKNGGALKKLLPPFKFFIGGPLGTGMQWFPWVHLDDVVNSIIFSLENKISGAYNAVSPDTKRMKEFCLILGKIMKRPSWLSVPGFILKILLGEMSQMLITGQKIYPRKLLENGYKFKFEKLERALSSIIINN